MTETQTRELEVRDDCSSETLTIAVDADATEADISYEMPEEWCGECERVECDCTPVELWYTAKDEDGDEVEFSISLPPAKAEGESEIDSAIAAVCHENNWDFDSVQDSQYGH